MVFGNMVLREIFGPKREEVVEAVEDCFIKYQGDQIKEYDMGGACSTYGRGGARTHTHSVLVRKLKGKGHSEDAGVYGSIMLEWIVRKQGGKFLTGCICFRICTSGGER
jgi:hypothetical protein